MVSPGLSLGAGRGALLLIVAIGGACSVAWVLTADAGLVWQQARAFAWWVALPAVALTLANVLLRLIRWQFFLRRSGIRLPMRQSAGIFVAGLAMLLTPAYAGEGVKTWLVARARAGAAETASPGREGWARAAGSVVAERLFDAMALCLVGGVAFLLSGEPVWGLTLGGAGLLGVGLVAIALRGREARHLVSALLLSILAWLCGCLTLYVVCRGVRLDVTPLQAIGTYSAATLLGGLTLLPAGVGVVGTAMLIKLQGYGASLEQAVLAAVLVRLLTVWLTAALGVTGCWHLWWQQRRATPMSASHFDALAPAYADQLCATARDRVVTRKVQLMLRALRVASITPGARILDAGCGHGWYVAALTRAGYHVTGVDLAPAQLAIAGTQYQDSPLATATVLA
ncbi:MAG: flippase-like domain-containing protein, partial [Chloroflexota bacterium]|nr:flippase-like domain-containing protein [Chloroflexota bacterium]